MFQMKGSKPQGSILSFFSRTSSLQTTTSATTTTAQSTTTVTSVTSSLVTTQVSQLPGHGHGVGEHGVIAGHSRGEHGAAYHGRVVSRSAGLIGVEPGADGHGRDGSIVAGHSREESGAAGHSRDGEDQVGPQLVDDDDDVAVEVVARVPNNVDAANIPDERRDTNNNWSALQRL